MMRTSRTPEIMGDAAYVILAEPSREFPGQFCIDDKLLYASGVRDFDRIDALVPLSLDFLVPDDDRAAAWRHGNAPALGRSTSGPRN